LRELHRELAPDPLPNAGQEVADARR